MEKNDTGQLIEKKHYIEKPPISFVIFDEILSILYKIKLLISGPRIPIREDILLETRRLISEGKRKLIYGSANNPAEISDKKAWYRNADKNWIFHMSLEELIGLVNDALTVYEDENLAAITALAIMNRILEPESQMDFKKQMAPILNGAYDKTFHGNVETDKNVLIFKDILQKFGFIFNVERNLNPDVIEHVLEDSYKKLVELVIQHFKEENIELQAPAERPKQFISVKKNGDNCHIVHVTDL